MPSLQLVIAPAAKKDLSEIFQFGLRHWGQARSESYMTAMENQLWLLAAQPLVGTERPELLPDTRSLVVESHTLFYRVAGNRVEVIRVRHGRQDPKRHVKQHT